MRGKHNIGKVKKNEKQGIKGPELHCECRPLEVPYDHRRCSPDVRGRVTDLTAALLANGSVAEKNSAPTAIDEMGAGSKNDCVGVGVGSGKDGRLKFL